MAQPRTIQEIMTRNVETCPPDASVQEVARLMADRNVGSVPICEGDRLVGVITDRDIAVRVVAKGLDARSEQVGKHISGDVKTVRPDTPIDQAFSLMEAHQVRRLPVCEGDRIVGIVAIGDLATKASASPQREERVGETLEEISKPSQPGKKRA
jgi:CBS domain-containing protein